MDLSLNEIQSYVVKALLSLEEVGRDIVLASSVHSFCLSTLFVLPEPYLSTYWSDLIHSWYKELVLWTLDIL